LLAVAFVPLYFAVARLTEASLAAARRDAAGDLGRAVAAHVIAARPRRPSAEMEAMLEAQLSDGGVVAIGLYGAGGERVVAAGRLPVLPTRVETRRESTKQHDRTLLVAMPHHQEDAAVVVAVSLDVEPSGGTPLVRLVALYTAVVGGTLLIFAYFAMTRLVVQPIDDVSRAASRVAAGARQFELKGGSPREIAELGESLRAMTEKLRADEEALRAKIDELEKATRELRAAQDTVVRSEQLASVGRLAAGVAHEIGNPIAAILGFEDLLLAGDLSSDEQRDFLERMKRETERVNRVLRDLLDFARPGPTGALDAAGSSDVAETAEIVAALLKPQKPMQKVELELAIEVGLPGVAIARERLQQVLLNLLLNAADAAASRILLTARPGDGGVHISVEDDGPGIAKEVRDTIFEPFVTTKEVGKGTGLGLAVCRGLVEAAGGVISVGSSGLGGARFELRLPVASEPPVSLR
jgi:two-component system NtrC family sensor kinase